jgi:hypothetical protein
MDISGLRKPGSIKAWLPVCDEVVTCPACAGEDKECTICKGTGTVENKVRALCAHIDQEAFEDLRTQATVTELDPVTKLSKETIDPVKLRNLIGRAVVQDIEGITDGVDAEGNDIPLAVTPENIDLLMGKWARFRVTIMTAPTDISRMLAAQREEQKKN